MIGMSVVYVEYMKDVFSSTLTMGPDTREELDKTLINVPYTEIILDFSGIKSMSFEFAKEYCSIKNKSNKTVNEVNLPLELMPIMDKASECNSL
ncbi:hypothetical protein [Candidatus Nitrosocosmicus franklandus]|uniref:DUF4325 domain-containing protein n=1 Tax=Candidatus Nitrosocosmicus franklandianus TaxID=1798806 RepID=A0A484I6F5_9ARCH|nr:hypothetical protein [Candidatus Nitrosocosmicus franklandus]VFJ13288.1 conserved protein of unknown function [Candidatus Nitrosocosmicus franklandus]